ncbi:MAG: hypothetical protein A2020_13655 [Lentisphaerae bacterium GWF2_45_14]|nr:MAG: hypothetical protein A2020_13655 [Lentisphaerae bacterium GWF2_45_14]
MKWHELGPFTVFDLETTGMSAVRDRIVEIAAVRVNQDGSRERFTSLVNPGIRISPQVSRIHNITNDMVVSAPFFREAGYSFMNMAAGSTLVAHNARFDLSFLQESLSREGISLWDGKTMDSIPIIKRAYSGLPSYSLGYLRNHFGLGGEDPSAQAHRAFADVEWTLEIFGMAMEVLIKVSAT